jgi:MoxR-like ATPase
MSRERTADELADDSLMQRNFRWWTLYCRGKKQHEIAAEAGVSQQVVAYGIKVYRATIPPVDVEEERRKSIEMLHALRAGALDIYDQAAAPLVRGKDGDVLYDPVTNELVRDHSGRVAALLAAIRVDESIRKRMGADAPTKVETTGSVKYELVGVDPETLT